MKRSGICWNLRLFVLIGVVFCLGSVHAQDDLQEYINKADSNVVPSKRAGDEAIVVDLSQFSAVVRENTLNIGTGKSYLFINGTLDRATTFDGPVMLINNGSKVDIGNGAVVTGRGNYACETIRLEGGTLDVTQGVVEGSLGSPPNYIGNPWQSNAILLTSSADHFYLGDGEIYGPITCYVEGADIRFDRGKIMGFGLRSLDGGSSQNSPRRATPMGSRSPYIRTNSDIYLYATTSQDFTWGYFVPTPGESDYSRFVIHLNDQSVLHLQKKYEQGFYFYLDERKNGDIIVVGENYTITQEEVENMDIHPISYQTSEGWKDRDAYLELKNNKVYLRFNDNDQPPAYDEEWLQKKLDEIAARGTATVENPEAIELVQDIVIDKQLFVRNGCHAVLTGSGRLRFTTEVSAESLVLITDESSLKLENCNYDTNSVLSSTTKQVFRVDWKSSLHFVSTFFFNDITGLSNKSIVYLNGGDVTFDYLYGSTVDLTIVKGYGHVLINGAKMVVSNVPVIDGTDMIITMNNGNMDSGGECVVRSRGNSFTLNGGSVYGTQPSTVVVDAGSTYYNSGYVGGKTTICRWGQILDGNMRFNVDRIIFKSNNLVGGAVKLPILEFDKEEFQYILLESAIQNEWQIDAQWSEFPLETKLIYASEFREYKKLTKEDFEKMTFLNMPDDREAYYDETDCSVKLREKKVGTSDDLQDFIDGLGDNKGTEDDPVKIPVKDDGLTIDDDVNIDDDLQLLIDSGTTEQQLPIRFAGGFICIMNTESSFSFNNVLMTSGAEAPSQHASSSEAGIKNNGKLKLSNSTVGEGLIENNGSVIVNGQVTLGYMQNRQGGRLYVTSALTKDVFLVIDNVSDVETDTPIILGTGGYTLTAADANHIHITLPSGYAWKFDGDGIIVYSSTSISTITNNHRNEVIGIFDASGRRVNNYHKGLTIQRKSNGTVKKTVNGSNAIINKY